MILQGFENLENLEYHVQAIVYVYISIVTIGNQLSAVFSNPVVTEKRQNTLSINTSHT